MPRICLYYPEYKNTLDDLQNTRELRLFMVTTKINEPPATQEKGEVKTQSPTISSHIIFVPEGDIPPKGLIAVIPAYNEELVIGSVVLRTRQYVERVIVVDDGSSRQDF